MKNKYDVTGNAMEETQKSSEQAILFGLGFLSGMMWLALIVLVRGGC